MKTLKNLRDACLNYLDEAGDTGTTKTLVDQFLDQAHRLRLTANTYPFMLWPQIETFTLTSGVRDYTLHAEFHRPLYFFDTTTGLYLSSPPDRSRESLNPYPTDTMSVTRYTLNARMPVQAYPATASVLTVVSTSGSDSGSSLAITVRGNTASGVVSESITPAGISPASGTTQFVGPILSISKGGVWAGTLTVSAGATTILTLLPSEYGRNYTQLRLVESPNAADVIAYEFYRRPSSLVNDYDVTDIPPPFEDILVFDALLLMAGYLTDVSAKSIKVWQDMQERLEDALRHAVFDPQGIGAEPRYVRYTTDVDLPAYPRYTD